MNTVINGYGRNCNIKFNDGRFLSFKLPNLGERIIRKHAGNGQAVRNPIVSYEILNQEETVSTSSAVKRGIVGSLLGGTVGGVIGASSAKTNKSYTILLHWKDGKDSLIEIDDKYYKVFIKNMV